MRGFNLGDILTTQDHKHTGKVTKINTVKKDKDYDIEITIDEGDYKEYTDSIRNFIIF